MLAAACSHELQDQGKERVAALLAADDSPYQAEVKIFRLPAPLRHLNHYAYGLKMGRDGMLYVGIGDNKDTSHLLRFDPATETISDLGNVRDALPAPLRDQGNYGKLHTGPHQTADGTIYLASHTREYWDGVENGRLFRYRDGRLQDLGPTPNDQSTYFMHGDDTYGRLYLATRDCRFVVYDLATGEWRDKGRFTSKAPFIGLTDTAGRLYVYGHDGKGDWVPGPSTISRYDPATDTLLTSKNAPPSLWVGAVTPDHVTAYTTTFETAEIFTWQFAEWPNFKARSLGRIDPMGRDVFSNDLTYLAAMNALLIAGSIESPDGRENIHGLWLYEIATGRRYLIARLDDAITESFGTDSGRLLIYWNNADTVGADGWVYMGIKTVPTDPWTRARLLAVRVQPASPTAHASRRAPDVAHAVAQK